MDKDLTDVSYEIMPIQPYSDAVIEVVRRWYTANGKSEIEHSYRALRLKQVISERPTLESLHKALKGKARLVIQPHVISASKSKTERRKRWFE